MFRSFVRVSPSGHIHIHPHPSLPPSASPSSLWCGRPCPARGSWCFNSPFSGSVTLLSCCEVVRPRFSPAGCQIIKVPKAEPIPVVSSPLRHPKISSFPRRPSPAASLLHQNHALHTKHPHPTRTDFSGAACKPHLDGPRPRVSSSRKHRVWIRQAVPN